MITTSTLLKRQETADRLRLSIRKTDLLIASGDLASVRIGRTVLVRESAIELFIEARENRVKRKKAPATDIKTEAASSGVPR